MRSDAIPTGAPAGSSPGATLDEHPAWRSKISSGGGTDSITVVFPQGRGVPRWRDRGAESPVPNEWPYGLDQLGAGDAEVGSVEVPPLGPVRQRLGATVGLPRSRGAGVALTWDEVTAPAMLAHVPASRRYCGVIWATDEIGGRPTHLDRLVRRALGAMDGLWVLSRPQAAAVREWLGPSSPPVHHLPFGVDSAFYAATPFPERPLVASVGGDRDRDPETLLAAAELVVRARPEVEFVVQSRTEQAAPRGVTKVESLRHDEVRHLLARAQVVALATRYNLHASGMTVALEAMSAARPVVASDTPGMDDYIVPGRTGHLVPSGDAGAMAQRVLELLDSPDQAAALGRQGRAHVEASHTTRTMCDALLDIIGAASADP